MNRGWYFRFFLAFFVLIAGLLALWPSVDTWLKTPGWVRTVFSREISPGLDIRGGLRLMYEVEVDEAVRDRRDRLSEALFERLGQKLKLFGEDSPSREEVSKAQKRLKVEKVGERRIRVRFTKASELKSAEHSLLRDEFPELKEIERRNGELLLAMREDSLEQLQKTAVEQTERTIRNRIDELQIREMTVIGRPMQGDIIVEVPGDNEAMFDRIRTIISRTARLDFKVLDDEGSAAFFGTVEVPEGITKQQEQQSVGPGKPPATGAYLVAEGASGRRKLQDFVKTLGVSDDHDILVGRMDGEGKKERWRTYYLFSRTDVTGEDIKDASIQYDAQKGNNPYVAIRFNTTGAGRFERLTGRNVQRRMAIVLDGRVESAPTIQEKIGGGNASITLGSYGGFDQVMKEAEELTIVLKAGALPAPIKPSNEQLIGPSLGQDSIQQGALGAVIGVGVVLIFMLFYYQVAGIVADTMVLLNLVLLLAILSGFGATLTLPGIAGIALTVGMAVDANVLITERIREEVRTGKSPRSAVDQGYRRAVWSILDSQITTFIAGIVLFQFGTGPIKGFAVTLMIGILTSIFTGMFCSKIMLDWIVRGLKVQRLRVG